VFYLVEFACAELPPECSKSQKMGVNVLVTIEGLWVLLEVESRRDVHDFTKYFASSYVYT